MITTLRLEKIEWSSSRELKKRRRRPSANVLFLPKHSTTKMYDIVSFRVHIFMGKHSVSRTEKLWLTEHGNRQGSCRLRIK